MAILDLQGLEEHPLSRRTAGHSGASKDCFNTGGSGGAHFSGLSLLLC
ncbi:MAG: hypothetical protein ACREN2_03935 [Candidatus Dormibacteria bacterium]